ncbi:hypothetical protein [Zobellia sp. 1_MG-2023]|uniref:hypothetical protein n=1 Tax=Zobellia sp. 1_MG-2023 TaxID=3062626 RepID=UPI0026E3F1F3|nr:hypothetical protein [Zobellia sp. 1_MG-2023]MDO6821271.1 hypothetical protein [Zobellia sp. 1_MG-2023]
MKTIKITLTIVALGLTTFCQAQQTQDKSKTDTTKQMNLLDEQTKVFGEVFNLMGAGADNPVGDATNYLELIENMDMSDEMKQSLTEQYEIIDLGNDPTKKEELKAKVNKMLNDAKSEDSKN